MPDRSEAIERAARELAPDEEWVQVGTELWDDPATRHFNIAARRILNQIPVFERRKKWQPIPPPPTGV